MFALDYKFNCEILQHTRTLQTYLFQELRENTEFSPFTISSLPFVSIISLSYAIETFYV